MDSQNSQDTSTLCYLVVGVTPTKPPIETRENPPVDWNCPICNEPCGNTQYPTLTVIRHKDTGQLYAMCVSHPIPSIYEKTDYNGRCFYDNMNLYLCEKSDCDTRCRNAVYKSPEGSQLCHNCSGSHAYYSDLPEERQKMANQLQGKYGKCQVKDCNNNLNHKHTCNNHPQGVCKTEGCNELAFNWRGMRNDREIERMEKKKKKIKNTNHIGFTEFKDNLYCWEHSSQSLTDYMENLGEDKNDDFLEFI